MNNISDESIDMILCDLPYGTTKCKWDSIISLEELWKQYCRIIKENGAIVLFAQTPFDKVLGASNLKMLRYEWIWEKTQATGHLNAKKMPMKAHENLLVFYKKLPTYNPQMTEGHEPIHSYTKYITTQGHLNAKKMPMKAHENLLVFYKKLPTYNPQMTEGHEPIHSYTKYITTQNNTEIYGKMNKEISGGGETIRYPRSVLTFPSDKQTCYLHPTQKPLALCEYMVKTYTNEGDLVLDNCMGSGTTGLSCKNLNRRFIGIEKEEKYFEIAKDRINNN